MTRPAILSPPPPSTVPRLGVLWCPNWAVVAAQATLDEPVVVLQGNRVIAHSLAAASEGISVGQRRRQAQACCPHVRLVAHDPDGDARRFENVVAAIAALIPRIEVTEPGMLSFLAKGPSRYFGGEPAMAERMTALATAVIAEAETAGSTGSAGSSFVTDDSRGLETAGRPPGTRPTPTALAAVGGFGMGIADGRFAAGIAARRAAVGGRPVIIASGVQATAAFLAPLPVQLLASVAGLDDEFVEMLKRLGVRTLGQLATFSLADVLARFGRLGEFAHRIAGGGDDRPPDTVEPPSGLVAIQVLDDPAHHVDTLVFIARQLADELAAALGADGKVCTRLVITAETDHSERNERLWYRSTGLSAAAMVERARWQLDAWVNSAALTAGVIMLRLEPVEVRSDAGVQLGLWGGRTQADEWAARAVARLATLAGAEQVLVPAATGGRLPGDAFTWVPAVTADLAEPAQRLTAAEGPWPGSLPSPSPAMVHAQPLAIEVLDDDGRPVQVTARGAVSAAPATVQRGAIGGNGSSSSREPVEPVVAWAGPWPLEERWWDAARARRSARFQLLTGSGSLLLVCLEHQRWWLLGDYR
ncbi:MAG: DNA polymerase Y family protein [Ilumatobacteraceae bacterium]